MEKYKEKNQKSPQSSAFSFELKIMVSILLRQVAILSKTYYTCFEMKKDQLKTIRYISIPENFKGEIGDFHPDPKIKLPVQLKEGKKELEIEDITIESIVAGMLIILAYEPENPYFDYYKKFVLSAQPNAPEELNAAAIAKEQQKDYEFAEQLFVTVYSLAPQSASCINLATLYTTLAANERKEKDEKAEDYYLDKALHTLVEGLEKFGENEGILAELGSLHTYLGNLEEAEEYLTRYMKVAKEGEKKQKLKSMLKEVSFRLQSDNEIKQAYDYMMLEEESKALEVIEHFIKNNPKLWHGWFIKGWALRKLGRFDDAEKALVKCVELGEANSDIYNELSICALERGSGELAKNYLDSAIDLDEDNLTLISNKAFLHLRDEEYDEAKYWLEKARKIAPEDTQIKQMMSEYTEKTGEEFKDVIYEEYVHTETNAEKGDEDDGYAEELAALSEDEDECDCGHHHHHGDECDCAHHHHEGEDE